MEKFIEKLQEKGQLTEKLVEDLIPGDKLVVPWRGVDVVSGIRAKDILESFPATRSIYVDFGVGISQIEYPRGAKVKVVKS